MPDRESHPPPQGGNALISSVCSRHIRREGKRSLVSLQTDWPALFEDIPSFGRVLSICRNRYAVLGRLGEYPRMFFPACGHCAGSPDGTLNLFLAPWHQASATVKEKPGGALYGAEFLDRFGDVLHKICLGADSHYEAFHDWTLRHQASPAAHAEASRPPASPLHNVATLCPSRSIFLEEGALKSLFHQTIRAKIRLRLVVGNEGMVQGADMTPECLEENAQWIFVKDPDTGLHLRTERLSELVLEKTEDGETAPWTLKAFEPEGQLVFALVPPQPDAAWNEFVFDATRPFHLRRP